MWEPSDIFRGRQLLGHVVLNKQLEHMVMELVVEAEWDLRMDQWALRDEKEKQRSGWINPEHLAFLVEEECYVPSEENGWPREAENTVKKQTTWRIWDGREKLKITIEVVKKTETWKAV